SPAGAGQYSGGSSGACWPPPWMVRVIETGLPTGVWSASCSDTHIVCSPLGAFSIRTESDSTINGLFGVSPNQTWKWCRPSLIGPSSTLASTLTSNGTVTVAPSAGSMISMVGVEPPGSCPPVPPLPPSESAHAATMAATSPRTATAIVPRLLLRTVSSISVTTCPPSWRFVMRPPSRRPVTRPPWRFVGPPRRRDRWRAVRRPDQAVRARRCRSPSGHPGGGYGVRVRDSATSRFAAGRLGPARRRRDLRRLAAETFDVLVIGGGVTGAGAAVDAAARGLSVALVEARDLAAGTSSRSSKLVHGGLRYLEQAEFGLVHEAMRERGLLVRRLAPHLVRPVPILVPLPAGPLPARAARRLWYGAGLALYDALAGPSGGMPRHRHLSRTGARRAFPGLRPDALTGAIRYVDAQVDDARL